MRLLSGRRVPPWALRSLVGAAVASAGQRGLQGQGAEELVSDGNSDFVDSFPNRFAKQVRFAAREVPFYRDRLAPGAWADRSTIPGLDLVPITTRQDLASAGGDLVAGSARPAIAFPSTGTTGSPVHVWFSAAELDLMASLSALSDLARGTVRAGDVVAMLMAPGVAQAVGTKAAALVGALAMPLDLLPPRELLARLVTPVTVAGMAARPTVVVAAASLLAEVVVVAEREGLGPDDFDVRAVYFGGEVTCSHALTERATRLFGRGIAVTESYGITEVAPVSGTRCENGHLHFGAASGLVEVKALGADRWAEPGEMGTLVVTPLAPTRSTTPLLRYDTGDLVMALDPAVPLDCSLATMPATSPVLGKAKDLVEVGGAPVTPRRVVEALATAPSVPFPARYALCGDPEPRLAIVVDPADGRDAVAEVEAVLWREGLGAVAVAAVPGPAELRRWHDEHGGSLIRLRADRLQDLAAAPGARPIP